MLLIRGIEQHHVLTLFGDLLPWRSPFFVFRPPSHLFSQGSSFEVGFPDQFLERHTPDLPCLPACCVCSLPLVLFAVFFLLFSSCCSELFFRAAGTAIFCFVGLYLEFGVYLLKESK